MDQLREAILDGSMVSGSPLPSERQLQEAFGVGRTTIREALRAVEAEGLVSRSAAGGWRAVAEPTVGAPLEGALVQMIRLKRVNLDDLADLRLVLETAAVERAARTRPQGSLATAHRYLDVMRRPGIGVADSQAEDVGLREMSSGEQDGDHAWLR